MTVVSIHSGQGLARRADAVNGGDQFAEGFLVGRPHRLGPGHVVELGDRVGRGLVAAVAPGAGRGHDDGGRRKLRDGNVIRVSVGAVGREGQDDVGSDAADLSAQDAGTIARGSARSSSWST